MLSAARRSARTTTTSDGVGLGDGVGRRGRLRDDEDGHRGALGEHGPRARARSSTPCPAGSPARPAHLHVHVEPVVLQGCVVASAWLSPTTPGTLVPPPETKIVTVLPLAASVPAAGFCRATVLACGASSSALACSLTVKPLSWSALVAVCSSLPLHVRHRDLRGAGGHEQLDRAALGHGGPVRRAGADHVALGHLLEAWSTGWATRCALHDLLLGLGQRSARRRSGTAIVAPVAGDVVEPPDQARDEGQRGHGRDDPRPLLAAAAVRLARPPARSRTAGSRWWRRPSGWPAPIRRVPW